MKARVLAVSIFFLASSVIAFAQDTNPPQQPGTTPGPEVNRGQRGGRGFGGGAGGWGGGMMGRGVLGTVTEVAADHYTVKTSAGEIYTVHFSVNTHIMKGEAQRRGQKLDEPPANPPQPIKPTDIKVGDAIAANGKFDAEAKSIGAVVIFQIDPERAKQMREMQANYGKTWLMGKVTAVNELTISIQGGPDNATHSFVADENTAFRKRREPITLADIQVGDMVRVEGVLKDGTFTATTVADMGVPQEGGPGRNRRDDQPQQPPQ